jgi:hypothetical protein
VQDLPRPPRALWGTEVERGDLPGRLGRLISPKLLVAGLLIIAAIAVGLVRVLGGGEETATSGGVPTKQLKGVVEIDPATNELGDRAPISNAIGVQLGEGFLWVVDPGHLYKVNPDTSSIVAEFENSFKGLTVGYRAVWTFIDYQSPATGSSASTHAPIRSATGSPACPISTGSTLGMEQYGRLPLPTVSC